MTDDVVRTPLGIVINPLGQRPRYSSLVWDYFDHLETTSLFDTTEEGGPDNTYTWRISSPLPDMSHLSTQNRITTYSEPVVIGGGGNSVGQRQREGGGLVFNADTIRRMEDSLESLYPPVLTGQVSGSVTPYIQNQVGASASHMVEGLFDPEADDPIEDLREDLSLRIDEVQEAIETKLTEASEAQEALDMKLSEMNDFVLEQVDDIREDMKKYRVDLHTLRQEFHNFSAQVTSTLDRLRPMMDRIQHEDYERQMRMSTSHMRPTLSSEQLERMVIDPSSVRNFNESFTRN